MATKKLVVFIDSGDTIIDESTEIRDERGVVIKASPIPGAVDAVCALHAAGYPLVMVADGRYEAFHHVHTQSGLWDVFDHIVDSETVGVDKPDALMFRTAMDKLGLTDADKPRIIMIGNNLECDIAGANRFGIRSALQTWSKRYNYQPESVEEIPTYVVHDPSEWQPLCDRLNAELQ